MDTAHVAVAVDIPYLCKSDRQKMATISDSKNL